MDMSETCAWEHLRTDETRRVEDVLRQGFAQVDAYRYNTASIRIRIVDPVFRNLRRGDRVDLVEPALQGLPKETQRDIINIALRYPEEDEAIRDAHCCPFMRLDQPWEL